MLIYHEQYRAQLTAYKRKNALNSTQLSSRSRPRSSHVVVPAVVPTVSPVPTPAAAAAVRVRVTQAEAKGNERTDRHGHHLPRCQPIARVVQSALTTCITRVLARLKAAQPRYNTWWFIRSDIETVRDESMKRYRRVKAAGGKAAGGTLLTVV